MDEAYIWTAPSLVALVTRTVEPFIARFPVAVVTALLPRNGIEAEERQLGTGLALFEIVTASFFARGSGVALSVFRSISRLST